MGDSRGYDEWARRIAAGEWFGREVFYQAPLYPYLLGVIYAVAGRHLLLVRIVQAVIGSASCALLALAAARLFSRQAGIAAGLMLALYAPAIFFDGLLQKSVLDVFFVCLALWLISRSEETAETAKNAEKEISQRSQRSPRFLLYVALGLTMGGLALTRENALVFIVVILAWIVGGTVDTPNAEGPTRPAASRAVPGGARDRPGPRRGAQQLRRRRLLHHDVAVRPQPLHRQQPGGRRHLPVAAVRARRAGIRAAGRHRSRRARARASGSRRPRSRATGPTRRWSSSRRSPARGWR